MPRKGSVMIRIGRRIGFPLHRRTWVGHVSDGGLGSRLDLAVPLGGGETQQVSHRSRRGWAPGAGPERPADPASHRRRSTSQSWRKARRPPILRSHFMAASIYPVAFKRSLRGRSRGRTRSVRSTSTRWSSRTWTPRSAHRGWQSSTHPLKTTWSSSCHVGPIRVQPWTRPRGRRAAR